jgi:hypothetical protein
VGAKAFKKDVKNLEFQLYATGHLALESFGDGITAIIRDFLGRKGGAGKQNKQKVELV